MSSSRGLGPSSGSGVGAALEAVREASSRAAETLLQHVPDTGDHATGRVVDTFVEQAGDTLRALVESLTQTLADSHTDTGPQAAVDRDLPGAARAGAGDDAPRGWHW